MSTFTVDPHRLEELLNHCVDFAKQMIEGHGEFYPFGAVIASNGKLTAVGAHVGEEHPNAAEVYRLLQNAIKSMFLKGEIIAGAVAANVDVPAVYKSAFRDGIRVHLECVGYSRFIYLPYGITTGRAEYGKFISVDFPPRISSGGKDG